MSSLRKLGEPENNQPKPSFSLEPTPLEEQGATVKPVILLMGEPKHGKTTACLTLSEKFSLDMLSFNYKGERPVIDDIAFLCNDLGAMDGPRSFGIKVKYFYDLSQLSGLPEAEYNRAHDETVMKAVQLSKDGVIKGAVYDGITTYDIIQKAFMGRKGLDTWATLDALLRAHRELLTMRLFQFACPLVIVAHLRPVGDKTTDAERARAGIEKGASKVIGLAGLQAGGLYRSQLSYYLPIKKTEGATIKDEDKFALYPRGVDGIEADGRWPQLKKYDTLPPNLRHVFSLIQPPTN